MPQIYSPGIRSRNKAAFSRISPFFFPVALHSRARNVPANPRFPGTAAEYLSLSNVVVMIRQAQFRDSRHLCSVGVLQDAHSIRRSAVVIGEPGGAEHDTCTGINAVLACGCLGTATIFEIIREFGRKGLVFWLMRGLP